MNDPVLPYPVLLVELELLHLVPGGTAPGDNLYNQVRGADASCIIQLLRVADHGNIGLHHRIDVVLTAACFVFILPAWTLPGKAHVKGGGVDLAGFSFQKVG